MAEKFDIGKLIRGFNIFNGATFGKLIQQAVMVLLVLGIIGGVWYKLFYQRTNVQNQNAQQITNTVEKKAVFKILGITLLGWES